MCCIGGIAGLKKNRFLKTESSWFHWVFVGFFVGCWVIWVFKKLFVVEFSL